MPKEIVPPLLAANDLSLCLAMRCDLELVISELLEDIGNGGRVV